MNLNSRLNSIALPKNKERLKHRSLIVGNSLVNKIDRVVQSCNQFTNLVKKTKKSINGLPAVGIESEIKQLLDWQEPKKNKSYEGTDIATSMIQNKIDRNWALENRISKNLSDVPLLFRASKKLFSSDFKQKNNTDLDNFNKKIQLEKKKRKIFKSVFKLGRFFK